MCTTCGCGGDGATIGGKPHRDGHDEHHHHHDHDHGDPHHHHDHDHEDPHHHHDHEHPHDHEAPGDHGHHHGDDHGHDHGHAHGAQAPEGARMLSLEASLLAKNDAYAAENRRHFEDHGILALNLVSSPGSGKTTLLCETIRWLKDRTPMAVIEGDQQTDFDADRIRETGVPALQINTGKGCHLDAHMVGHAAEELSLKDGSLLFIENVGNLVCPAGFDLGEAHKVVILSVTEGEDKPLKYPDMFAAADLLVMNKVDLLPHLRFDLERCLAFARRVNPELEVIQLSAATGEGMEAWIQWLEAGLARRREALDRNLEALRRRVADLEGQLAKGSGKS